MLRCELVEYIGFYNYTGQFSSLNLTGAETSASVWPWNPYY